MHATDIPLWVTCAAGLEGLVAEELKLLGAQVSQTRAGRVCADGTLESAYRVCLWSRFAARVLLPVKTVRAEDTDMLYQGALNVDWSAHLALDRTFAVDCTMQQSPIHHSRYAALRVKDAVADQFRERFAKRPSVDTRQPDVRLHVVLDESNAVLCIDLSGDGLHRRGYRLQGGDAPLRETLAAAMLRFTGWPPDDRSGAMLIDPMCGSGTLLVEGALMCADIAPGLGRARYGFSGWRRHDAALWQALVAEAEERAARMHRRRWPRIAGFDAARAAVRGCAQNIRQAGLEGNIHVERKELAHVRAVPGVRAQGGFVVVNPPYGERLGSHEEVKYLYRCIGRTLRQEFTGWRAGVLTGADVNDGAFYMEPQQCLRLYNGSLACKLWVFMVPGPSATVAVPDWPEIPAAADAENALANRLRKNMKRLKKWVKSEGVECFRLYDADMPEYNVAVDLYDRRAHVQEYAPPATVDPRKAQQRLKQAVVTVRQTLGLQRNQVFMKVRRKQKGGAQYQKQGGKSRFFEVREGPCRFLVNLGDYIDTGLFLDHRAIRARIRSLAAGRRFLNLYAYTGSATVHAAAGGAASSVSVDASPVYLQWARNNLALNGFSAEDHHLVRSDCMAWLRGSRKRFDIIFVSPPTFSNSKSAQDMFDVQRDHSSLIRLAMRRLERGGVLFFSTNFRRFKLDDDVAKEFDARDITSDTIPFDFARSPRIHRCWEFSHRTR